MRKAESRRSKDNKSRFMTATKEPCKDMCCGSIHLIEDSDEDQRIMGVEDKSEWEELEAVVDSGSVDHVVNPRRLGGHRIIETE